MRKCVTSYLSASMADCSNLITQMDTNLELILEQGFAFLYLHTAARFVTHLDLLHHLHALLISDPW